MPEGAAATVRHELIGLAGVFERNVYLVKRYIWWDVAFFVWTVANTLTIVFIAKGIEAGGGKIDVNEVTTVLLIGAVVWAYLGIIFEILTETVAWERWDGAVRDRLRGRAGGAALRRRRPVLQPSALERELRRRPARAHRRLDLVHR